MQFPSGKMVIGRITDTAINAAAADITFKDINGVDHVFAAGERLIIKEIHGNNRATAKDVTIFQDQDNSGDFDAGEEIIVMSFAAAGYEMAISEGLPSFKINAAADNTFMAVASAAGNVDLLIIGEVVKA